MYTTWRLQVIMTSNKRYMHVKASGTQRGHNGAATTYAWGEEEKKEEEEVGLICD